MFPKIFLHDNICSAGEGISTVMETVESSLGAPTPEEVAHQQKAVHEAKEPSENGAPGSNHGKTLSNIL